MSIRPSRRKLLSATGAVLIASLVGCADLDESEEIDVTVSNASPTPIGYEVTVGEVEKTGTVEASGSDQYEDELSQPESSTRFDVVASFERDLRDGENETQREDTGPENGASENESSDAQPETGQFRETIEVTTDVLEVTIAYTGGEINVNTVVAENNS